MRDVQIAIWFVTGLLALFAFSGVVLFVQALLENRRRDAVPRTWKERLAAYVGPLEPGVSILPPPMRVVVEFISASCGFPGLGWLISGRVVPGIVLLVGGAGLVWGLVPVGLALTGLLLVSPYSATFYLPVLGAVSACALALTEWRVRRAEA